MITLYTHRDLDGFHQALAKSWKVDRLTKREADLYLILADWFADHGDADTEACLRWQVSEGCRPYRSGNAPRHVWHSIVPSPSRADPPSDLPYPLYALLEGYDDEAGSFVPTYKVYRDRRAAQEALWRAWPKWGDKND